MIRFTQEENIKRREEYYDDPLFVTLCDAIDEVETQIDGLTPEEVWSEVLRIKDQLLSTKYPDKTIQRIRTDLQKIYQYYTNGDDKAIDMRQPIAAVWSSVVVLTCVMFYLCTVSPLPEKNMKIALKIRKLIWDHPAYIMLRRLQRPAEKEIEDDHNPVPNEDRLHPLVIQQESPELATMRKVLTPVIGFFLNTLLQGNAVKPEFKIKEGEHSKFCHMWMTLLQNEGVLRTLSIRTLDIDGFKPSSNQYYQAATTTHYNLKFVLNIIGIMKAEKVIEMSNEDLSSLFFTKNRPSYFSNEKLSAYGEKASVLNATLHNDIIAIIRKFKTPENIESQTS